MFFYRYNRGPRGRMYGHGGRLGLIILGILGLIGFAPIGLAVLSGLCIGGMAVIGGLLAAAADILSSLGSGAFTAGGVAVGIVIGLLLYKGVLARRAARRDGQKEESAKAEEDTGTAEEYYPTDTFHSYGA